MILFDRKKALNQIMGPSEEKKKTEMEHPAHIAAKEAIAAVHAHDHEGFANATKALMLAHDEENEGNASEDHES